MLNQRRLLCGLLLTFSGSSLLAQDDPGLPGRPGHNRDATREYLRSLQWAENVPYSDATFYVKWKNDSALVKVVPMLVAQNVSWHEALIASNGHFVARIENLEHKRIQAFNMRAEDNFGYLWVGQRVVGTGRGAAIYVIDDAGRAVRHRNLRISGFCKGQHPNPKVRSTEGGDCPGGIHGHQPTRLTSFRTMFYQPASGLWVSCRGGCCEVKFASES